MGEQKKKRQNLVENKKKAKKIVDDSTLRITWSYSSNRIQRHLNMSTITQARMEVEQLRREAAIKRIPVSQVVEDIKRFAMDHMMQDHLIVGFASEKANPFREKTWSCEVL